MSQVGDARAPRRLCREPGGDAVRVAYGAA